MSVQKILKIIIILSSIVLAGLFFTSCYSAKKADKQVNKALYKHPEIVAHVARFAFPCIPTSVDSNAFKNSISKIDSLLNETRNEVVDKSNRLKEVEDSLEKALKQNRDTSFTDCAEENKGLVSYASRLQVDNERLKKIVNKNDAIILQLKDKVLSIKPVIQKERDSADLYLAMKEIEAGKSNVAKWEGKFKAKSEEADTYKLQRNKARKINWILFVLIGIFVGWRMRKMFLGLGNVKFFGSNN